MDGYFAFERSWFGDDFMGFYFGILSDVSYFFYPCVYFGGVGG